MQQPWATPTPTADALAAPAAQPAPRACRATAYNVEDLRRLARRTLPKGLFEFVDRGTENEVALRAMRAAVERVKLE